MKPLTPEQQIQVLENIDWGLIIQIELGLCYAINRALYIEQGIFMEEEEENIESFIPLFTRENALHFRADAKAYFWWKCNRDGYKCRKEFINWIIEELKK